MIGTAIYWTLMKMYNLMILLVSVFNPKAKLWIKGRKKIFKHISRQLFSDTDPKVWFHCASLGEFEQARPVIELFRKNFPQYKIILTFFSPSGYEAKKNCQLTDYVFYLPLDTPRNARMLVRLFSPKIVFFSKYDFWYFILKELNRNNIPVILFSAIFRENQLFFKKIGSWYRQILLLFTHIFVQDEHSKQLLNAQGIYNVTVSGDTRFDRVVEIASQKAELPCIEKFTQGKKVIVAGSTYTDDAKILSDYINSHPDVRLIIAPHEINEHSLQETMSLFYNNYHRYSILKDAKNENPAQKQVLIIDTIGLLSKIYRYATITYVGGGFGAGIHNILEAVVYGKPVIFGPNYHKFKEARDLLDLGVAFTFCEQSEFFHLADELFSNPEKLEQIKRKALEYINTHTGSSKKVIDWVKQNIEL